jgi:hypothetical protein
VDAAPKAQERRGSERGPLVLLVLALLGGGVLRLRGLGAAGLWSDELVSWWAVSSASVRELVSRCTECMAIPPGSLLLQHASVGAFGKNEWALRLPSALAGIAAILLVFLAGRRFFGAEAGAVAALVLSVHPVHLWFSADARPYSLAVLFAAASIWAFHELTRDGSWRNVLLYALATAGLLHVQFVFLPLVGAQAIAVLLGRRTGAPAWRCVGLAFAGAGLLSVALLPQFLGIAARAGALSWPAKDEFPPGMYALVQSTPLLSAAAVLLILALAVGRDPLALIQPEGEPRSSFDLLALVSQAFLPLVLLGLAALRYPSLVKPRYYAVYLVPIVLLLGWGLTRPAWVAGRRLLVALFVALILATQVVPELKAGRSFNRDVQGEDWRGAVRMLLDGRQPGDAILLRSGLVESAAFFRGETPERCESYLTAPLSDFYFAGEGRVTLLPQEFEGPPYPPAYARRIGSALEGVGRIWIVMLNPPNPNGYLRSAVAYLWEATGQAFRPERSGSFGNVNVILLTPDPGTSPSR